MPGPTGTQEQLPHFCTSAKIKPFQPCSSAKLCLLHKLNFSQTTVLRHWNPAFRKVIFLYDYLHHIPLRVSLVYEIQALQRSYFCLGEKCASRCRQYSLSSFAHWVNSPGQVNDQSNEGPLAGIIIDHANSCNSGGDFSTIS